MAKVITDNQHYADIAAAIRTKNETETVYKPSEMAPAILAIKGGVELNFEIVGSTTQPENPSENTIWVNTDQEITGWSLSVDEPAEPVEGMVWIESHTDGLLQFNALKENVIQVNLVRSKQYVSGTWIGTVGSLYQGGEWFSLALYLYDAGNEYESVTGGWIASLTNSSYTASGGYITKYADCMQIKNVSNGSWGAATQNKIDLTAYRTLHLVYSFAAVNANDSGIRLWASPTLPTSSPAAQESFGVTTAQTEVVMDVSAVDQPCIIAISDRYTAGNVRIYKVWLD